MADDNLGFDVIIRALTDEKSADQEINKLIKQLLKHLKDGYIEVPAKINFGKNQSKEIKEAQANFRKEWNKMADKGFFADKKILSKQNKKELASFIESLKEIKNLSKGKIGNLESLSKLLNSYSKNINKIRKSNKRKSTKFDLPDDKEIQNDIDKQNARIEKSIKNYSKKRKIKEQAQIEKDLSQVRAMKDYTKNLDKEIGTKKPSLKQGNTSDYALHVSELSPYRSQLAEQDSRNRAYERIHPKPVHVKTANEEFREEKNRQVDSIKDTPNDEKYKGYQEGVTTELSRLIKEMMSDKGTEQTLEDYNKYVDAMFEFGDKGNLSTWNTIRDTLGSTLSRLYSVNGRLGGTNGGSKSDKSYYDLVEKALEDTLNRIYGEIKIIGKSTIETQRQSSMAKTHDFDPNESFLKKDKSSIDWNSAVGKKLQEISRAESAQLRQLGSIDRIAKIENDAERVADNKEGENNRALLDTAKSDASTGGNTDKAINKLESAINNIKQEEPKPETSQNEVAKDTKLKKDLKKSDTNKRNKSLKRFHENISEAVDYTSILSNILVNTTGLMDILNKIYAGMSVINDSIVMKKGKSKKNTKKKESTSQVEEQPEPISDKTKKITKTQNEEINEPKFRYGEPPIQEHLRLMLNRLPNPNPQKLLPDFTKERDAFAKSFTDIKMLPSGISPLLLKSGENLDILEKALAKNQIDDLYKEAEKRNENKPQPEVQKPIHGWSGKGDPSQLPIKRSEVMKSFLDLNTPALSETLTPLYDKITEGFSGKQDLPFGVSQVELKKALTLRDQAKFERQLDTTVPAYFKREANLADKKNASGMPIHTPEVIELGEKSDEQLKVAKESEENEKTIIDILKNIFAKSPYTSKVDQFLHKNEQERAKEAAERRNKYGSVGGRGDVTDLGSRSRYRYLKRLWHGRDNKELFQNVQLTPSLGKINPKEIESELQKVLQDNMFDAQTGGWIKNLLGPITLYLGQDSIEKTRAQIEGLNQVFSDIRQDTLNAANDVVGDENILEEMRKNGTAIFDDKGNFVRGTPEAEQTFTDLENKKDILSSLLAEVKYIDEVVKATGGDYKKILKTLYLTMPELMKENTILQNINSGLDKNGKALKFQKRTQEVLNYSFQLMSRHIGQMIKSWIMMLNPISLIKKAFADFASYNVKWQRTMNVIKYNIRHIIRPFMEWLAQQFVNIIGLANALVKGIGKAFGKNWDLFDKDAANAEKIKEELEAASEVSAGFDELHDIGSDNTGANDLLGDIYTPQWEDLNAVIEKFRKYSW